MVGRNHGTIGWLNRNWLRSRGTQVFLPLAGLLLVTDVTVGVCLMPRLLMTKVRVAGCNEEFETVA